MGKFDEYYSAQSFIESIIEKEIVGPQAGSSGENEIIDGFPLNYYVAGILWPQTIAARSLEEHNALAEQSINADLCSTPLGGKSVSEIDDTISNDIIFKASIRKPSTMGISFLLTSGTKKLFVDFQFGRYTCNEEEVLNENNEKKYTKHKCIRKQYSCKLEFDLTPDLVVFEPIDKLEMEGHNITVQLTKRTGTIHTDRLFTISVENKAVSQQRDIPQNENALFQCKLLISVKDAGFVPLKPSITQTTDLDDMVLNMQYRNIDNYAQGHGCATKCLVENDICLCLESKFVPSAEVQQMKSLDSDELKIYSFAYWENATREQAVGELRLFLEEYKRWLQKQSDIGKTLIEYQEAVSSCISKIRVCIQRIERGILFLEQKEKVWNSFVFMNKAMLMQRISMAIKKKTINSKGEFDTMSAKWYPFQLFYLIMMIPDIVDKNNPFSDTVDLLWFPTGGGKTEAYLAVSAFTIFYDRLTYSGCKFGTTVIMRYTLRLLTVQQFERAAALICSCEEMRRNYSLGNEEISIGLWIGNDNSPKDSNVAAESLKIQGESKDLYGKPDPMQITTCPVCGKTLFPSDYVILNQHMYIKCPNRCLGDHLPIYINDNDIYDFTPTLIISTVDKFARIVWEEKTGRLFGCNINVNKPRLIIQDELHLISGPLGTLTGLYETAVDRLCWDGENKPKIIVSTATVKNASEQIKALYNRPMFQFPPSGIDYSSNFFSKTASKNERPMRTYLGLSLQGGSMIDLMIRSFSALCISVYFLEKKGFSSGVVDQYYSIIGYFNSLKELGTSATVIKERMEAYINSLLNTKFKDIAEECNVPKDASGKYVYLHRMHHGELTSRRSSPEIKNMLNQLENTIFDGTDLAYKYMLSSNMFSVGVDIDRLGVMTVYGQPKSNAEYIQATSRVGRSNPGLILSLYNAARSRDRSYYENFSNYHSMFYKYVESSSVTPFSERSIEKALHSIFVALVRHLVVGLEDNRGARKFCKDNATVQELLSFIYKRIESIQKSSLQTARAYLNQFINYWHNNASVLVYDLLKEGINPQRFEGLLLSAENSVNSDYVVLNSVRNVDRSSNVFIEDGE